MGFKEDMVHLGTCTLPATTEGFGIYVLGRQHVLTILQEAPCHLRMLLSRNASHALRGKPQASSSCLQHPRRPHAQFAAQSPLTGNSKPTIA